MGPTKVLTYPRFDSSEVEYSVVNLKCIMIKYGMRQCAFFRYYTLGLCIQSPIFIIPFTWHIMAYRCLSVHQSIVTWQTFSHKRFNHLAKNLGKLKNISWGACLLQKVNTQKTEEARILIHYLSKRNRELLTGLALLYIHVFSFSFQSILYLVYHLLQVLASLFISCVSVLVILCMFMIVTSNINANSTAVLVQMTWKR